MMLSNCNLLVLRMDLSLSLEEPNKRMVQVEQPPVMKKEMEKAIAAVKAVTGEVDKLSDKVVALEVNANGGTKVPVKEFDMTAKKGRDIIGFGTGSELEKKLKYAEDVSYGIIFCKELVNSIANILTLAVLSEEALKLASMYTDVMTANILNEEQCKELKMGSLIVDLSSDTAVLYLVFTASYHALERREASKGGKEATRRDAATQHSSKSSSSAAPTRLSSSNGTCKHEPPSSNTGNHHSSKPPSSKQFNTVPAAYDEKCLIVGVNLL